MRTLVMTLLLALCAALATAPVHAQSKQDLAQAKTHFKRGKAYHDLGQYAQAAEEYGKAYELSKAPLLLFNMGQVTRLDGKTREAVDYYRRYLAVEPEGKAADEARKHIVALTAEIEQQDAARRAEEAQRLEEQRKAEEAQRLEEQRKAEQAQRLEEQRKAEQARRAEETRATADSTPADVPPATVADSHVTSPSDDRRDAPTGKTKRYAGIALGAVGVVGIAVGFGWMADINDTERKLSELSPQDGDYWEQELYDAGERSNRYMIASFALGGAALVTGGVLYYLGHREGSRRSEGVTIAPTVRADGVGIGLAGSF